MATKDILNKRKKKIESVRSLEEKPVISSKLNGIVGMVLLPDDFEEKIALYSYFEKKHL